MPRRPLCQEPAQRAVRRITAGICEVYAEKETPCVWHEIYERAKALGRLDKLLELQPAKSWKTSRDGGQRKIVREDLRL